MKKQLTFIFLLSFLVTAVSAQKFKPAPVFLGGKSTVNIEFNFSKVTFDGDSQAQYYREKGKAWVEEWEGIRREQFKEKFINSANDELKKIRMKVGDYPDAEYTFIVVVVDCDFGAYAGPFSTPAKIKSTINVVKTGTSQILSSITLKESQNSATTIGTPIDFDRMYLAFSELAEEMGDKLVDVLK